MATDQRSTPTTFGELLRRHRLAAGLTQEELAERAGISVRGLSDLERGARTRPQRETVRLLAEALELSGAERDQFLFSRRQHASSLARAEAAAKGQRVSSRTSRHATFPRPLDSLIGRDAEIATVAALLQTGINRLVTLTGPGGVGKTRLALAVADALQRDFRDGVWFVDLAPLSDPALVASTIAAAVGACQAEAESQRDALAAFLAEKHLLLVLDNFEHLLPAATLVSALLQAAPNVAMLATSRVRLRLRGEREFLVSPLALPESACPGARHDAVAHAMTSPAVALFVTRAAAVKSTFVLTPENVAAVTAICQRLDGLPLALELAAAWARMLRPEDLAARLVAGRLALTGGARDLAERQQTVRSTVSWSYDLLPGAAQVLFRRLGVFAGGWTLEAAEAICAEPGCPDLDVLGELRVLVEHHLVVQHDPGLTAPRFTMLETIRQLAVDQLESAGETEHMRTAHAAYYCGAAPGALTEYHVRPTTLWRRLLLEIDNMRLALDWAASKEDYETGLWLAHLLAILARGRGSITEARQWNDHFLLAADGKPSIPIARALYDKGRLALYQDDTRTAANAAARLAAVAKHLPDEITKQTSQWLNLLVALQQSDMSRARKLADQGLVTSKVAEAEQFLRPIALELAAVVAFEDGDFARAVALWQEALTLIPPDGDPGIRGGLLANVAHALYLEGELSAAIRRWIDTLDELRGTWDDTWNLPILGGIVQIAHAIGRPDLAARLLAASTNARQFTGLVGHSRDEAREESQLLAQVRETLGEKGFAPAWEVGRLTPLEALLDETREILTAACPLPATQLDAT